MSNQAQPPWGQQQQPMQQQPMQPMQQQQQQPMQQQQQQPMQQQQQPMQQQQQQQQQQQPDYVPQSSRIASAEAAMIGGKLPYFNAGHTFVLDLAEICEIRTDKGKEYFVTKWDVVESTDPTLGPEMKGSHMIRLNGEFADGAGKANGLSRLVMESLYQQPAMTFANEQVDQFLQYVYSGPDWSAHPVRVLLTTVLNKTGKFTHHNYDGKEPGFVMGLTAVPSAAPAPVQQQVPVYQQPAGAPVQQQQQQAPQAPNPVFAAGVTPPWQTRS